LTGMKSSGSGQKAPVFEKLRSESAWAMEQCGNGSKRRQHCDTWKEAMTKSKIVESTPKARSGLRVADRRVGIFWLLEDGRLLLDSTALAEAEHYGDCITHPRSHIDTWAELQRCGVVRTDVEYEEPPRGRVVYDADKDRFVIYADRCILRRKKSLRQIMRELNLPQNQTETSSDLHYRCLQCVHS